MVNTLFLNPHLVFGFGLELDTDRLKKESELYIKI